VLGYRDLVGINLSEPMLARAAQLGIYASLHRMVMDAVCEERGCLNNTFRLTQPRELRLRPAGATAAAIHAERWISPCRGHAFRRKKSRRP